MDCSGRPHTARTPTKSNSALSFASTYHHHQHQPPPSPSPLSRFPSTMTVTVASTNSAEARLATPTTLNPPAHALPPPPPPPPPSPFLRASSNIYDAQTPLGNSLLTDDFAADDAESVARADAHLRQGSHQKQPPATPSSCALPSPPVAEAVVVSPSSSLPGYGGGGKSVSGQTGGKGSAKSMGSTPKAFSDDRAFTCGGGGGGDSCASEGLSEYLLTEVGTTPRQPLPPPAAPRQHRLSPSTEGWSPGPACQPRRGPAASTHARSSHASSSGTSPRQPRRRRRRRPLLSPLGRALLPSTRVSGPR
ncbi:proline-rich protein 18-like [Bactrocera neohumeralis]|uniref:proline-rich protein 18-like n=1 Tax=Bactrocera neohumeralis TaxID=98809 RepID=UPI002165E9D7|nr:proline-rich protein 18-like [Bactrocera neohumeralis]